MVRRYAALCVLILIWGAVTPGCGFVGQDDSDPEALFYGALDRFEAEGGSVQRSEGGAQLGALVAGGGYGLNPLSDPQQFRREAELVELDELSGADFSVVRVHLRPEAARAMLERQMRSNVEQIKREAELTLEGASGRLSGAARRELEGELRSRLDEADQHIGRIADDYDVSAVIRLWIDRDEGKATRMQVDTTIVPRDGGAEAEERMSDTYTII